MTTRTVVDIHTRFTMVMPQAPLSILQLLSIIIAFRLIQLAYTFSLAAIIYHTRMIKQAYWAWAVSTNRRLFNQFQAAANILSSRKTHLWLCTTLQLHQYHHRRKEGVFTESGSDCWTYCVNWSCLPRSKWPWWHCWHASSTRNPEMVVTNNTQSWYMIYISRVHNYTGTRWVLWDGI